MVTNGPDFQQRMVSLRQLNKVRCVTETYLRFHGAIYCTR